MVVKPILVAIGGPTSSGKSSLAIQLNKILPNSVILYQDDFAPPVELVPINKEYGIQDWDDPEGGIMWAKQREAIRHLKQTGDLPADHTTHAEQNVQPSVRISQKTENTWTAKFEALVAKKQLASDANLFVICDGFLIFYDEASVENFDVKLFVREEEKILIQRRIDRQGYFTADQSDMIEGAFWKDPPGYWENIVWPAYLKAHRKIFKDQDVIHGQPEENAISGLILLEGHIGMEAIVEQSCEAIYKFLESY